MNNQTIGIIGAMQVECDALVARLTDKTKTVISGVTFVEGSCAGHRVVCAVCGIGKVFAAICTEAMILHFHPDFILNTGVAGGLDTQLHVGDIAIASDLVQHDMDTSPLGDPKGMLSGINLVHIPAEEHIAGKLKAAAEACHVNTVTGTIVSGDQFINSDEKRAALSAQFGGIACEMEGAAIAHVCYVNHVPVGVVRAISDSADGSSHMDYPAFVTLAAQKLHEIIWQFLTVLPKSLS